ncbi:Cadherin-23, partial [Goodea atripinnis]
GTFGRGPQAKPEDDRYLRAAIQEYDNIAKLGQIMREGPIKGSLLKVVLDDYLRLKKLFAARLVTVSTSEGDKSSITEVGLEEKPLTYLRLLLMFFTATESLVAFLHIPFLMF